MVVVVVVVEMEIEGCEGSDVVLMYYNIYLKYGAREGRV